MKEKTGIAALPGPRLGSAERLCGRDYGIYPVVKDQECAAVVGEVAHGPHVGGTFMVSISG